MATMNVSLPEPMKAWVESRTQDGRYSNASDYVRDLIRRDQEQREAAIGKLRVLMDRAEASGISEKSLAEVLQAAREEARQTGLLRDAG
jgi:antitoxin ParD1/3/4